MNVYDLIADHYGELFPVEAEKLDFIQHLCPLPGRLCDAGCATGDLALGLHQRGYDIYGLDLNAKMIGIAEQKAAHTFGIRTSGELAFHRANIADILQFGTCNGVLCFGNTLPHLPDEAALRRFFSSVYQSLQGYGVFIVEVLNYDRILAEKKMNFKDKETDAFIFKRRYERQTLLTLFEQTGFQSAAAYSDYSFTESRAEDYAVVYVAKKCILKDA